jgi:molecular chaperone GrpE
MAPEKKIVIEDDNAYEDAESSQADQAEAPVDDGADDAGDPVKALEEQLTAAKAEAKESHDRMLRMAAELENYKKRMAREQDDLKKYATEKLIGQLLTVVDNLERAIASTSADNCTEKSVADGVAMTLAEVMKILEKHNVTPITALGEPFDPAFHQAMCQEACPDQPPNTVIQEYQKGYLIHDRLLRPAMVVVSKSTQNRQPDGISVDTNA